MVAKAHTIVDPRTMMVHPENARAADSAMMASVWLILRAPFAVSPFSRFFLFLQVECHSNPSALARNSVAPTRIFDRSRDSSWMHDDTLDVAYDEQQGDNIESTEPNRRVLVCYRVLQ